MAFTRLSGEDFNNIMTDYPREFKSFYMKQNTDTTDGGSVGYKGAVAPGPTMQGTDVLFPQIGEIIGGSVREESYDKLRAKWSVVRWTPRIFGGILIPVAGALVPMQVSVLVSSV